MPAKRALMRQIRDVLRLKHAGGLSDRAIGRALGLSYSRVAKYVVRAAAAGLSWPLPADLDEGGLECRLFQHRLGEPQRPQPNWPLVHTELKRPGVTLRLLWEESRTSDGKSLRAVLPLINVVASIVSSTMTVPDQYPWMSCDPAPVRWQRVN
ncbi:MAG: hypothetical protein H6851_20280 [Geminicoccaceae bacterium]|nr:hypothetical protein [Geminicoccaceae bacterium]